MTTQHYSKRPPSSQAPSPPSPPGRSHYAALADEEGPNPIDAAIDRLPEIAAFRRPIIRAQRAVLKGLSDPSPLMRLETLVNERAFLREVRTFDAGVEHGRVLSGAASLPAADTDERAVGRIVREISVAAFLPNPRLPRERLVALLLELARALVLGLALPRARASGARAPAGADDSDRIRRRPRRAR
jgi:hypothetical protein